MDEVNPMAEMGLVHDKQIIIEPQGFLTPCNTLRNLAAEFIDRGAKLYDMFERYDSVITYILNRDNVGNGSDAGKLLAPFLRAFEAGDYDLSKYYRENLPVMPGAAEAMRYFLNTLPTFIDTRMYEHAAYALCEATDIPISIVNASTLELDNTNLSRQTARDLRKIAGDLGKLRISKTQYELNVPVELDEDEVNMISALDEVFLRKLQKSEAGELMQNTSMVGSNEKAYALLDIRKGTQVDLDGTAYVGGEQSDFQVLDLVKDGNGLAISFNGAEFAVHGSNIAILSEDATVVTVLVSKFYDTGIQGVFDLADNWNREYLETADFPDRNLVDDMLRRHPKKLPEVYRVTRDNVSEIATKSDAFRTKLFKKYEKKAAKKN